jgi:hypothetical protein
MGRGGIAVRLVYFGLLGSSSLLWIRVRTFNFLLETEVEMAIWFRTVDWILALTHQQKKKKNLIFIMFYYIQYNYFLISMDILKKIIRMNKNPAGLYIKKNGLGKGVKEYMSRSMVIQEPAPPTSLSNFR